MTGRQLLNHTTTLLALVGAVAAAGCTAEEGFVPEEYFGHGESWIINGALDYDHDAVVAIFTQQSACTGTIIHVNPPSAYILTAAHCFGLGPVQWNVIGDDYNSPQAVLNTADYLVHPSYDDQQLVYDFAIIRATGASASTPVIPAMTPAEDNLHVGSPILHVGYGLVSYPNGDTSQRHRADGTIDQIAQIQIGYGQPNTGPCSGDSGGPNIADAGGERVAGVVSYGDQQCSQFGVSGRVSSVYDSFIVPFIGYDPSSSSSSSSSSTSSGTGGSTSSSSGQGGSGAGSVGGGPVNDGWVAGSAKDDSIDGYIQQSGCATVASGQRTAASWAWLALGLAGLAAARRRR